MYTLLLHKFHVFYNEKANSLHIDDIGLICKLCLLFTGKH